MPQEEVQRRQVDVPRVQVQEVVRHGHAQVSELGAWLSEESRVRAAIGEALDQERNETAELGAALVE